MIVFTHLLNDRSGSPQVLCSTIGALTKPGDNSRLFIGSDGSGCLDETGIAITRYWYKRTPYRVLTLLTYMLSQLSLLLRLLFARGIDRNAVIYVNTLLPFGAALYGWLTGRPVIYHVHEISISPAPLRWFLTTIARRTAKKLIYVSEFHRQCLPIAGADTCTIYNSLPASFLAKAEASQYLHRRQGQFRVLMLASLRDYKGVPELLALAERVLARQDIHFDLVANDDDEAIRRYFADKTLPANVTVHPRTNNPAAYYAGASLVLNLSRPDQWVETFGLTLLEAMAFGVPVIAPPAGGPLEIIHEGVEGFLMDCREGEALAHKVLALADNEALCLSLSAAARVRAQQFSPAAFAQALIDIQKAVN